MAGLPEHVHEALGATWDADRTRPRNYGDPAAEYDAARNAAGAVDRADRSVVRVHGREPIRMVQGLVTNDVAGAPATRAVYAALLTPKGRMIADVRIVRHGADLLLECDTAALAPLLAHLRKFVPPLYARFEDVSAAWRVLTVCGAECGRVVHDALGVVASVVEDDVTNAAHDDVESIIIGSAYTGVDAVDILLPAAAAPNAWQRLLGAGARPIGHATLDVLRIEAGQPRWGAELDENTIPLEAGLRARAISETKGCYTGQEVIVRILHRGHVNWELRGVQLGDVAAPARDTPLVGADGARKVGRITSAAWSPVHGQAIALAYVRREIELPAQLRLDSADGPRVNVVALPFPAPGAP